MIDQMALEMGWDNEPGRELYRMQALLSNHPEWVEMLMNVLCMICDTNREPLVHVIHKHILSRSSRKDIGFGESYSDYTSIDDEMIETAPIVDRDNYDIGVIHLS